MTKRTYLDGEMELSYYLLHNVPDMWDEDDIKESYSIVARYMDGSIKQWFYGKDDLKRAFRVFRIMSVNRSM